MVQNASDAPELDWSDNKSSNEEFNEDGDERTMETLSRSFSEEEGPSSLGKTPTVAAELVENMIELNPKATPKDILEGAKILQTLIGNICDPLLPADDKKRRVRLRNPKIQKYIVNVEGALDIMEEAGFVHLVQDHEEILVFPENAETLAAELMHNELTHLVEKLSKDLKAGRRAKTKRAPNVSTAQQRKKERESALLRWKDDNTKEKARLIANRVKLERRQQAERRKEYENSQGFQRNVLRPYLIPVICAVTAFVAMKNPSRAWEFALYSFVLYWITIFFIYWASTESLGPFGRQRYYYS